MARHPRLKKTLKITGIILLVMVLFLVALPAWFPFALEKFGARAGLRHRSHDRIGYGRLVLNDVTLTNASFSLEAKKLELTTPWTWLWKTTVRRDLNHVFLEASDWELKLHAKEKKSTASTNTPHATLAKIDQLAGQLEEWVPRAEFTNGFVRSGSNVLAVSSLRLRQRRVELEGSHLQEGGQQPFALRADLSQPEWNLKAQAPGLKTRAEFSVTPGTADSRIEGFVLCRTNRFEVTARLVPNEKFPADASLNGEVFEVPGNILRFQEIKGIRGSVDLKWQTNQYAMVLRGTIQTRPLPGQDGDFVLRARGGLTNLVVEEFDVRSPWIEAHLNPAVGVSLQPFRLESPLHFAVKADLSKQTNYPVSGRLEGEVKLRPTKDVLPSGTFALRGDRLRAGSNYFQRVELAGRIDGDEILLSPSSITITNNVTAHFSGGLNAREKIVRGMRIEASGPSVPGLVPASLTWGKLNLLATADGPLTNLVTTVRMVAEQVRFPAANPMRLSLEAHATGQTLHSLRALGSVTNGSFEATLAGSLVPTNIHLQLRTLAMHGASNTVGALSQSAVLRMTRSTNEGATTAFALKGFRFRGTNAALDLDADVEWPRRGSVHFAATNLSAGLLTPFVARPLPTPILDHASGSARWNQSPIAWSLAGRVHIPMPEAPHFVASGSLTGNHGGIILTSLSLRDEREPLMNLAGHIPLRIHPGSSNLLEVIETGELKLSGASRPNPAFWKEFSRWTGITLRDPQFSVQVTGRMSAPQGELSLVVPELAWGGDTNAYIPHLKDLSLQVALSSDLIRVRDLRVLVEGEPVSASGELPVETESLKSFRESLDWKRARGQVRVKNAQIASFAALAPKYIAPKGRLDVDLRLLPGPKLEGTITVAGAATRPLEPFGPLQDVEANIRALGEELELVKVSALLGGESLRIAGKIGMPLATRDLSKLRIDLQVNGENIPLARQTEMVIRSDVDVRVANGRNGPPRVEGKLRLRESFFLSDLNNLVPGSLASPKKRPPYFSVTNEPFAEWPLALEVSGDRWLRIRSPFFRGEASTQMRIGGTLREPVALGEATLPSGLIQFPFASLKVDQGLVSLTSENPHQPQLLVMASARTFGYDIRMEVSGSAEQPQVLFSSNPGLTSEEILLMVTAGELPKNEIRFTNEQKATRLAFFLGKNIISKFKGADESEERLIIRSGENISEQGRQTYTIEYKLSEDWSILAEYDRFNALNAGFKWRFFSK